MKSLSFLARSLLEIKHGVFNTDPETKRQNLQWKSLVSSRPKKTRMSKSKIKVMLITCFDQKRAGPSQVFAGRAKRESALLQRSPWTSLHDRVRRSRCDL